MYKDFSTSAGDYSGNAMAGVPKHRASAAVTVNHRLWQLFSQWQFTDGLFLNDANSVKSKANHLVNVGLNKSFDLQPHKFTVGLNVSNLLNAAYSLGYDINAAGGRYYNAAALRTVNLRVGLNVF